MSKKLLLLTAVLGLVSFAGSLSFVWFTSKTQQEIPENTEVDHNIVESQIESQSISHTAINTEPSTKYLTEQQLKNLVQELRNKMQDYEKKLENLKVREQRLQLTQDILKQDIEKLSNLQVELASITANIKNEREKLLKSQIEIEQTETNNLASIAATYDKMDASSASIIISNMCATLDSGSESIGNSYDDAVKILYYMAERTKAKLLAELALTKPELAADLSRKLKQITEVD